jgi:hypothetical protein
MACGTKRDFFKTEISHGWLMQSIFKINKKIPCKILAMYKTLLVLKYLKANN